MREEGRIARQLRPLTADQAAPILLGSGTVSGNVARTRSLPSPPAPGRPICRESLRSKQGRQPPVACEVSWFGPLCDDDYEFLGVPDAALLSSWEHCRGVALGAEEAGYDNLLLPSNYGTGIDSVAFAAGVAPLLRRMQLLVAVRMGEMWPPQLARQLATIDEMLGGRLTLNIISSDLPGEQLESAPRYRRTLEIMRILRDLMDGKPIDFHGEFFNLTLDPPRIRPAGGCPPFYFGGLSEAARDVAAQAADVFLMWPDTMPAVEEILTDMRARAARHGRELKFGYRVHVVVRATEQEARTAAQRLVSRLDDETGRRNERPAQTLPRDNSRGSMTSSALRKPQEQSGGGALADALRRASEKSGSGKTRA